MNQHQEHLSFARNLRTEIMQADTVWLPRREDLLAWLNSFIRRIQLAGFELGETEVSDMAELDRYLRRRHVPAAAM